MEKVLKIKSFFYYKDYNNHFQNSHKGIIITEPLEHIQPDDLCVEFEDSTWYDVKSLDLFAVFTKS